MYSLTLLAATRPSVELMLPAGLGFGKISICETESQEVSQMRMAFPLFLTLLLYLAVPSRMEATVRTATAAATRPTYLASFIPY